MLMVLAIAGLLVLLTGVVAAVLLALGTVLALIFAVSVWQAGEGPQDAVLRPANAEPAR